MNTRYTGTRDYTAYCAVTDAFRFRESLGGDGAIKRYIVQLALDGGELLAKLWGTFVLVHHRGRAQ